MSTWSVKSCILITLAAVIVIKGFILHNETKGERWHHSLYGNTNNITHTHTHNKVILEDLTFSWEFKLPTGYCCFFLGPPTVTNAEPLLSLAQLHSSVVPRVTSHKSDVPFLTHTCSVSQHWVIIMMSQHNFLGETSLEVKIELQYWKKWDNPS